MNINFLQIGFQKCGTTSLEKNVYPHNPHIECIQETTNLNLERVLLQKFILSDGLEYNRPAFEEEFKNVSESVFTKGTAEIRGIMFEPFTFVYQRRFDRKNVIDRIYESFPDVKIIMPVRNQETWILSHYSQYLKRGGLLGLYDFVESFFHNPMLDSHYIDWFPLISYLYDIFDSKNILVYPYEELKDNPQELANKIFAFLGAPSVEIDDSIVNPSLSKQTLFLRRFLNHLFRFGTGTSSYNFSRDLNEAEPSRLSRLYWLLISRGYKGYTNRLCYKIVRCLKFNGRFKLDSEHRRKIAERYSSNNKKLAELLDVDLSSYGYP